MQLSGSEDNTLQASNTYLYFFEFTGTNTSPVLVAIDENLNRTVLSTTSSNNTAFAVLNNGKVVFEKDYKFWIFDEATKTSTLLLDFYPFRFEIKNGAAYFTGLLNTTGVNWTGKTNGTTVGTVLLKNSTANQLGSAGISGFFTVYSNALSTYEIYTTDGTQAGTKVLTGFSGEVRHFTDVNGVLFFIGYQNGSSTLGYELYKVQGTSALLVKDVYPGAGNGVYFSSSSGKPAVMNGNIYFAGDNGKAPFAHDLWRSDGTDAGTYRVRGTAVTPISAYPNYITTVGNSIYFPVGQNSDQGFWTSDGTGAGTSQISSTSNQGIYTMEFFNGYLYYPARTASTGTELYRYAVPGNTLPVSLVSFKGALTDKAVHLNWTAANEQNVKEYVIERSSDNNRYLSIGKLKANNMIQSQYTFTDNTPIAGLGYYRLKINDNDGAFRNSGIIAFNNSKMITAHLFPNPVAGTLTVTHATAEKGATACIFNSYGQLVKSVTIQLNALQTSVQVSQLVRGNYSIVITINKQKSSFPFFKN